MSPWTFRRGGPGSAVETFDVIVIGGGVVGTSVAFHLSTLGARDVLLLERETIGSGTTAQSSGILRTHYSVRENVELARRSWEVFNDFAAYVGDEEASCGLVMGFGFSGHGFKLSPTVGRVLAQEALGLPTDVSLAPYSIERFSSGNLLVGKYGSGAVS